MAEYRKGFKGTTPKVFSVARRGGDTGTASWYYVSVNELKSGSDRKFASVLMQPAKVRTLAYLLEKVRTIIDSPDSKLPLTLFVEQTGIKKDTNEKFSYGSVEIVIASRQDVKLRIVPSGDYAPYDFELPFDVYGVNAGDEKQVFKSYSNSLSALSTWITNEFAHYEAGGTNRDVVDKGSAPSKTASAPSYGGANEGTDGNNIPF